MRRGIAIRAAVPLLLAAGGALTFDLAYTQDPLYQDNASTYLLHGVADAGHGLLREDWQARSRDPFPVVSAVVTVGYRLGGTRPFYVLHALLLGLYLLGLVSLGAHALGFAGDRLRQSVLACLIILTHSAQLRDAARAALPNGEAWARALHEGVAGQYLLGPVFQPSLLGVLCVLSLAVLVHGRPVTAALLANGAFLAHASYGLTAGVIGVASVVLGRAQGRMARVSAAAALPWIAVAAVSAIRFRPTSAATLHQAQQLLATVRIPHHALPERWWGPVAACQVAWVLAAVFVARHQRLGQTLAGMLGMGAALTGVVVISHAGGLALLFPWRVSALLVPVATALWLAAAVRALPARGPWLPVAAGLAGVLTVAAAVQGGGAMRRKLDAHQLTDPALPLLRHVAREARSGDLYVIPLAFERFRLDSGAPTYVDWKSHPYLDREVLEWHRRVQRVQALEAGEGTGRCQVLEELHRVDRVTHVVVPAGKPLDCAGWPPVFGDGTYQLSRRALALPLPPAGAAGRGVE